MSLRDSSDIIAESVELNEWQFLSVSPEFEKLVSELGKMERAVREVDSARAVLESLASGDETRATELRVFDQSNPFKSNLAEIATQVRYWAAKLDSYMPKKKPKNDKPSI